MLLSIRADDSFIGLLLVSIFLVRRFIATFDEVNVEVQIQPP